MTTTVMRARPASIVLMVPTRPEGSMRATIVLWVGPTRILTRALLVAYVRTAPTQSRRQRSAPPVHLDEVTPTRTPPQPAQRALVDSTTRAQGESVHVMSAMPVATRQRLRTRLSTTVKPVRLGSMRAMDRHRAHLARPARQIKITIRRHYAVLARTARIRHVVVQSADPALRAKLTLISTLRLPVSIAHPGNTGIVASSISSS
eukprot:COSAG06_NODE_3868_length_4816_cov_1.817469_3_plen_204_part_00